MGICRRLDLFRQGMGGVCKLNKIRWHHSVNDKSQLVCNCVTRNVILLFLANESGGVIKTRRIRMDCMPFGWTVSMTKSYENGDMILMIFLELHWKGDKIDIYLTRISIPLRIHQWYLISRSCMLSFNWTHYNWTIFCWRLNIIWIRIRKLVLVAIQP